MDDASIEIILAELKRLFGPPPVLSTERIGAYYEITTCFLRELDPRDFIEKMFIRNLTDFTWDAIRYTRYKTLGIDSRFRQRIAFELQRKKLLAQRKEGLLRDHAEKSAKPPNELARIDQVEGLAESTSTEVDEILERTPQELDHVRALEASIEIHERLDRLLNNAIARRNDALAQFERYRAGLGKRMRKLSDEIIDVECNKDLDELLFPHLAPSDGEAK
jgi:hypothetical protein